MENKADFVMTEVKNVAKDSNGTPLRLAKRKDGMYGFTRENAMQTESFLLTFVVQGVQFRVVVNVSHINKECDVLNKLAIKLNPKLINETANMKSEVVWVAVQQTIADMKDFGRAFEDKRIVSNKRNTRFAVVTRTFMELK